METSQLNKVEEEVLNAKQKKSVGGGKFILFSLIGILAFFAPIPTESGTSIPIDMIVTWTMNTFSAITPIYALLMMTVGSIYPFITKTWNKNIFEIVFTILKVLGLIAGIYIFFDIGPAWLLDPNMGPFLFYELIIFVGLIVPIGGIFLTFLLGYGLLEYMGVLFQRIMRPLWKVPGRSAINALASRVASLVLVYLMTDKEYREGKYTVKEAVIIATGFITVEATFMVIIAKTVQIMDMFYIFFIVSMFVTFLVTFISARIWPINKLSDEYYKSKGFPEETIKEKYFRNAWNHAIEAADKAPKLGKSMMEQLKEAILMTMSILPAILSIGLIGLYFAEYTSIFDYIAYIFYPITMLLQIPDSFEAAKAASLGITEILLPSLVIVNADLVTRFIVAVVSVSGVLFFSTSIPALLSTQIPISIPKLIIIWIERVILSFMIVTPIAYLLF